MNTLTAPVLLSARGLSRRFDNANSQRAESVAHGLIDFDLDLHAGELVALLGPSGAGKTTALRLLAGLEQPQSGQVLRPGSSQSKSRRGDTSVALVFQQQRLVQRLTALDNALAGRLGHMSRWRGLLKRFTEHDIYLALQALEQVRLLSHASERTERLSGGEQQRLALARALTQQPQVLLADEPVASLDPGHAHTVLQVLRQLADDGMAVLCCLHQPELAQRYADRVVLLDQGRVVGRHLAANLANEVLDRLYAAPLQPNLPTVGSHV